MIKLTEQENEPFPIDSTIKVLDSKTIYKVPKWWCAVIKGEGFGKVKTYLYLWLKDGDRWKRKQKFTVPSIKDWNTIDEVVRKFISQ